MIFIVEGRRFEDHLQACTFAQGLAQSMGRAVDVHVEQAHEVTKVDRKWLAKMHPDGYKRPLKKNSPPRNFVAPAEAVS